LHVAAPIPVLALQDSDGTTNQSGYISFRNSDNNETGYIGFGDETVPDLAIWNFRPAGNLRFMTQNLDRMTITSSGNVGIGTIVPAALLHLRSNNPDIVIQDTVGTPQYGAIRFRSSTGSDNSVLGFSSSLGNGDLFLTNLSANGDVRVTPGLGGSVLIPSGTMGVGAVASGSLFHVNGVASKPGGGSWSTPSDERLKRNISPLAGALDALLSLRGRTFEYINPDAIHELPGRRIGMIAQEVETVFPDWVDELDNGYKSLTFRGFEALTVEALRDLRTEQNAQIDALHAENESLRTRLAELESVVDTLLNNFGTRK
jgi:hypothetical protein